MARKDNTNTKEIEMKKFEIRQTVIEVTIVEAVDEDEALDIYYSGEIEVSSYDSVRGGDDLEINEIEED